MRAEVLAVVIACLHGVSALNYPFGVFGGSVAHVVYMEAYIVSPTLAHVDILIRLPKATRLPVQGWALFHLNKAEILVEEAERGTMRVTFLPNGTESHPTAMELASTVKNAVKVDFPMSGIFNPERKIITYDFGPFDLILSGQPSTEKLMDVVEPGEKVTTFDTPTSWQGV